MSKEKIEADVIVLVVVAVYLVDRRPDIDVVVGSPR